MRPYIRHRRQHHRGEKVSSQNALMPNRPNIIMNDITYCCLFGAFSSLSDSSMPPPMISMIAALGSDQFDCASYNSSRKRNSPSLTKQTPQVPFPAYWREFAFE